MNREKQHLGKLRSEVTKKKTEAVHHLVLLLWMWFKLKVT